MPDNKVRNPSELEAVKPGGRRDTLARRREKARKRLQEYEGRGLSTQEFRLLQGILTAQYGHMEEQNERNK